MTNSAMTAITCNCEARSHLWRILGLVDTMAALGLRVPPVGQRLIREAKAHLDGDHNGSSKEATDVG